MIKQTHAYRAGLVLLADALARQDPAAVIAEIRAGGLISDLTDVKRRRHPDFTAEIELRLMNGPKAASGPALPSAAPRRNGVGLRRYNEDGSVIMTDNNTITNLADARTLKRLGWPLNTPITYQERSETCGRHWAALMEHKQSSRTPCSDIC